MRSMLFLLTAGLAVALLSAAEASAAKVEVKGPHICCNTCVNVVGKILAKVEGVSEVAANIKTKTVTFTAKDAAAAKDGFKALIDGGFFGSATSDGAELKLDVPVTPKGKTVETISVKDVHVCCGACKKAINGIFKDAKVTYTGTGPQLDVLISGAGLEASAVMDALRKAGFNGKLEK